MQDPAEERDGHANDLNIQAVDDLVVTDHHVEINITTRGGSPARAELLNSEENEPVGRVNPPAAPVHLQRAERLVVCARSTTINLDIGPVQVREIVDTGAVKRA
ncbi:hypothetical protein BaRGS_00038517, partial [Batillaria attramentaria]